MEEILKKYLGSLDESTVVRRKLGNIRNDETIIGFPEGYPDSILVVIPQHKGVMIPLDFEEGIISAVRGQ